jgi:hypothetical protein
MDLEYKAGTHSSIQTLRPTHDTKKVRGYISHRLSEQIEALCHWRLVSRRQCLHTNITHQQGIYQEIEGNVPL